MSRFLATIGFSLVIAACSPAGGATNPTPGETVPPPSSTTTSTTTLPTTTSSTTTTTTSTTTTTTRPPTTTLPAPKLPLEPGRHVIDLTVAGQTRSYVLYVPDDVSGPTPLLLGFHGFTSNPQNFVERTGFADLAASEGFLLALPVGTFGAWDALRGSGDVDFARAVVADVALHATVDLSRVYAIGFSNGGAMAARLGCDAADLVASVGVVSGANYGASQCDPGRAVAVVAFHGTDDLIVPFGGLGSILPGAVEWAAGWAENNGCDPEPASARAADDVEVRTWFECDENVAVKLNVIEGGGHGWPHPDPPDQILNSTTSISATDLIWEFVSGYSLAG